MSTTESTHQSPQQRADVSPGSGTRMEGGDATVRSGPAALRAFFRRWQFWVLLGVLGLLVALLTQLMATQDTERYGLENTSLNGYGALASVLEDQAVTLHRAHSATTVDEQLAEAPGAGVVVFEHGQDAPPQLVRQLVDADREIIWLSPSRGTRGEVFEEDVQPAGSIPTAEATGVPEELDVGAQCPSPAGQAAESIQTEGTLFAADEGCFTAGDPSGEETEELHALVVTQDGVLFDSPEAFTNGDITTAGHAALALGLFGQQDDLIWYTPSGLDAVDDDQWASPWDFMPSWVGPLTWWLLICTAVFILVAGRRHGPVVVEPLPVQVPASESAEGRGRMYQRADASSEAARTLRSAHLVRLAHLLRLGSHAPVESILTGIARVTGLSTAEITETVDTGTINSNAGMVRYAQELAALEDEVRIRLGHGPRRPGSAHQNHHQPQQSTHEEEGS